ncbi:MAG: signal peptidase II [Gemmatimonadota bacterium]|nr:signal peptidase II [Gemmatimonadota bacterium]
MAVGILTIPRPVILAPEFVLAGALTIALDAWTKRLVGARLRVGQSVALARHVSIRHLRISGASPRSRRELALWLAALGAIAGVVALLSSTGVFFQHPAAQAGLGAAMGGAASNLHDRGRDGSIVDFMSVGWWPPFNFADVGIVAGVAVAVLLVR